MCVRGICGITTRVVRPANCNYHFPSHYTTSVIRGRALALSYWKSKAPLSPCALHFSVTYFWPGLANMISEDGEYCDVCLGKYDFRGLNRGNYNIYQKILLVGEGDFSFSSSLATSFLSASNITATSLDSRETVIRKYSNGEKNLTELKDVGALVLHQVDAHSLDDHPRIHRKLFDRIVFNFPHAGGVYGPCTETASWYIECHQNVVSGFFEEAKYKLAEDGEIHVTHKTCHPFNRWNIVELAEEAGLMLTGVPKFERSDYPGYMNKRGYGSKWNKTFRVGECCTFMFTLGF